MIIFYAGNSTKDSLPENTVKKASVLLTYYDFWKRKGPKLPARFAEHKERRERKRAKGIS